MKALLEKNLRYLSKLDGIEDIDLDTLTIEQANKLAHDAGYSLENLFFLNIEAIRSLRWDEIKFVFLDVDGVLTEGGMFYTESGDEFKRFDTKDGMAIKTAMNEGLAFGIISSGVNKAIIQHRADMFGIEHVYVGKEPKLQVAEKWLENFGLNWSETAYVGDDINDLGMFENVGISACPADATLPIKKAADFVLQSKGGHGCIREFMRYFPSLKDTL